MRYDVAPLKNQEEFLFLWTIYRIAKGDTTPFPFQPEAIEAEMRNIQSHARSRSTAGFLSQILRKAASISATPCGHLAEKLGKNERGLLTLTWKKRNNRGNEIPSAPPSDFPLDGFGFPPTDTPTEEPMINTVQLTHNGIAILDRVFQKNGINNPLMDLSISGPGNPHAR